MSSEHESKVVHIAEGKSLVLFDGYCNLCNSSVQFILKRDPKEHFLFSALSWPTALAIMENRPDLKNVDSILLYQNEKLYYKSAAALRIAGKLKGFWPLLKVFLIIPAPIRDLVYDWIAKNRYKWFGKKETCMIPEKDLGYRFLKD